MRIFSYIVFGAALGACVSHAQVWQMQQSGTTAGLRGIDSLNEKVAWATGTAGTILKTIDGGAHWTHCAVPDADKDGATLDFRGVQAWDANLAVVMSSGKGARSRIYRTDDGCQSWRLMFTNPDPNGFWDAFAIRFGGQLSGKPRGMSGWILGDPVDGHIALYDLSDDYLVLGGRPPQYHSYFRKDDRSPQADAATTGAFAASNSALLFVPSPHGGGGFAPSIAVWPFTSLFVTGGASGARIYMHPRQLTDVVRPMGWNVAPLPLGGNSESSGAFSVSLALDRRAGVVVGGDYLKPNDSGKNAAYYSPATQEWLASTIPPHGYRSAVQWSESLYAWITVGANGSDISRDDGKTWQPLHDGNWNALSLPFVVGPNGRIAKLNPAALPAAKP